MISEDVIRRKLATIKYPGFSRDIVSFGIVKAIRLSGDAIAVDLEVTSANPELARQLQADCENTLRPMVMAAGGELAVNVKLAAAPVAAPTRAESKIPGIRRIVAVASGKGGVGKSTVSVNLACALQQLGCRVGLLDCDIYGPSIPLMMGVHGRPSLNAAEKIIPPENYGVKLMSMGFLIDDHAPVIWRGPMITKTVHQFFHSVEWGTLDYLLVDLPPGTGDAQLSLCQTVPLDGGVIVTTPQEAALGVARKGIAMFQKVNVPILGLVENMSYYATPEGARIELFGHGGGRREAERQGFNFLGEIPIYIEIRVGGDTGRPVVAHDPAGAAARPFLEIAQQLRGKLD